MSAVQCKRKAFQLISLLTLVSFRWRVPLGLLVDLSSSLGLRSHVTLGKTCQLSIFRVRRSFFLKTKGERMRQSYPFPQKCLSLNIFKLESFYTCISLPSSYPKNKGVMAGPPPPLQPLFVQFLKEKLGYKSWHILVNIIVCWSVGGKLRFIE